jgi:hypothetical protein
MIRHFHLLILLILLISSTTVFAQEADTVWVRYFGEVGNSVAMDIEVVDDGVVVVGTKSYIAGYAPLPALWLLKLDFDGNLLWDHEIGAIGTEKGYGLAKTADGGFVIAGTDWRGGIGAAYMVRTDGDGNVLWERRFSSDYASFSRDVEVTPDGGYIMTGWFEHFNFASADSIENVFITKTDSLGNIEWWQTYGGYFDDDEAWSIDVLDDGYVIGGRTWSAGAGMRDACLAKVDLSGNMLWYTTHGGQYKDHIYEFQTLPDGSGFIGAGKTESFGLGELTIGDIWLLRFDENGEFMWRSVIGTPPTEFGRSLDILPNGDYIVTGLTGTQLLNNQVFVGRSDPDGNFLWTYHFGLPGMDDAWCIRLLPDGDYIVGGLTESMGEADRSLLVLKVTENVVTPSIQPSGSNHQPVISLHSMLNMQVDIVRHDPAATRHVVFPR